jgi:DNA polymerase I-like protein with 3'-5' exonuclease and polymerase domains/uracil-DNA glycosylase
MSFNDCKGCPAEYEPCLKDSFGDNPAHIIVIGPAPSGFSIGQEQAFYGRHGRLFKQLLDIIRQYNGGVYAGVKAHYTYAAMVGAYEPKARHLEKCRPIMQRHFRKVSGFGNRRPILVPLGPIAAKAVGLNFRKITDIVGREMTTTTAGDTYTVVPLLSMRHLEAKIGVANVVLSSLLKAVSIAYGDKQKDLPLEVITQDYIYPRTIEEVRDLVDHVINYYDPEHGNGPEQWAISLDTETNTLKPFSHPDPKVLMLSVGWDDRRAATILLDHPETPYDSTEAWTHVNRLLTCAKPKCFHNWKFDKKFLETVYGYRVNRVTWDTLLGEHYIDEDKKGHYSLKQLTPIYCPEYEGYDDKLHEILRGHEDKEDEEDDYEEGDVLPLLLSDEEILDRNEQLGCPDDRAAAAWIALVGAVDERQTLKKIAAKERTPEQKRKFTDLKKEIDAARKAMNIMAPQRKAKKKKSSKDEGFSQVPLDTILQYAAVDADVTRLILRAQVSRLRNADDWEDGKRVMKYLYLPGTHTLSNMEFRGFQLNGEYQGDLIGEVQTRINDVKSLIAAKFDPMLNLNAPHQISEYMSRLNFESLPGEEDGSTGKDILAKYEKKYPKDDPRHVFVTKLLEYRESSKVMTTYLRPYTRLAKDDGKIHCQFHLNGTSTGRLCVDANTILETTHGTFPIAAFPGKILGVAKIETHQGRWRRILKRYYKGIERMYRVTLSNGNYIICTKGHRFLTPHGWRSLNELVARGQERCYICTPENANIGKAACTVREKFCENCGEGGIDRKRSPTQVQHQSSRLAHFDERLQEKVRQAGKRMASQTLCQIKVGKSLRAKGQAFNSDRERNAGQHALAGYGHVSNCRRVESECLVCSGKHQAVRPESDRPSSRQDAKNRSGFSGTTRAVLFRYHPSIRRILHQTASVLSKTVQGLRAFERVDLVCARTGVRAQVLRGEGYGSEGSHLLVPESSRDATIVGVTGKEHQAFPAIQLSQKLPGRFCVSKFSIACRSRRRFPSERHANTSSGCSPRSRGGEIGLPHTPVHGQRGVRERNERGAAYTHGIAYIAKIDDVGPRPVWDIEVEGDHSYVAQGFINHNSSSKPNLQNVPYIAARRTTKNEVGEEIVVHPGYNIKKLFVPSKPDYAMVNVDIKGAELRVYTAYSKDPLMIEALLKGMDVHSLVTSRVYKIPYDEVNAKKETDPDIKEKRTRCKRTVFGTFYGAGPFKIAQQINSTKEEAEQLQNFLFTEFPALADYVEGVRREVEKYQVVGTFFGRKRRFRLAHINHKNRAEAVREAVNFKIQSTSADLVLSQLCEMDEHSDEIGAEMLITVHDSIVLQMPQANLHLLHNFLDKWIVQRVAEKYDWLPVPFLYDVEVGPSYGEVKPFERKSDAQEKAAG